ncbi:MAG: radical SAM protein, partial [Planctomycetota bacterium]|nr:radical SAM protein [Planctomycetota bacterium]
GEVDRVLDGLAQVVDEKPSAGEGLGLLVELADGRRVESVLLPKDGLCVSTQVGCAVGCTFCSTGTLGLVRQLTALEILVQVVLARRRRAVRKVVFMGMGEPAHNLRSVLEAIRLLGEYGDIGHKDLVFSTVGEEGLFERLAQGSVRPALALSLHTTDAEKRAALLPKAPRVEPRELLEAAAAYSDAVGHPLQLQWTLLAGINDGDEECDALIDLVSGRRIVVNYIPFNPGADLPHQRVDPDRAHALTRRLHAAGVIAKLRDSAGQDVGVGCGQLRAASE